MESKHYIFYLLDCQYKMILVQVLFFWIGKRQVKFTPLLANYENQRKAAIFTSGCAKKMYAIYQKHTPYVSQMHELGPCELLGGIRKVPCHFVHGARIMQNLLPGQ